MGRQPVIRAIIDTDPGVDDALALIFAFKSPELRIEAITTVAGNVEVAQGYQNVYRIFDILGLPNKEWPPVFMGAIKPLDRDRIGSEEVHGRDGLGDCLPKTHHPVPDKPGPDVIIEWAERYPGEISLITLGPLTNLALAIRKNRSSIDKLKEIIIMAGAFTVPGNITPRAEYNIYVDPLAAQIVLQPGLAIPVTMVGLDVTRNVILSQEEVDIRAEEETGDKLRRDIRKMTKNCMAFYQKAHGFSGCYLHDPLAIAVSCDPSLVQRKTFFLQIDTGWGQDRGMIISSPGYGRIDQGKKGIDVCIGVEASRFLGLFLKRIYEPGSGRG